MVGGTKLSPQDSKSEPGCYERKTRATARTKAKTLHEGKRQKPSQVYVSLDNADTVIDGGPHIRWPIFACRWQMWGCCQVSHWPTRCLIPRNPVPPRGTAEESPALQRWESSAKDPFHSAEGLRAGRRPKRT